MATPAPNANVAVVDSDGAISNIAYQDLEQAVKEGARIASPDETRKAQLEAKYGGFGGEAAAFAAGVARGGTLGLSDVAGSKLGLRETLEGLKEVNPTASTAGELASYALPATGGIKGLKLASKLAVAPKLIGAAGRAAESGVARLVGHEATGLGGRMLQRGLASAASGAVEGGLMGVGHEISEAALKDHELTAEKLIAGAGKGALFGGGIGGALGAGGAVVSVLGKKALDATKSAVAENKSLSEWLETKAGERAWHAAGPIKSQTEKAEKYGGGYAEIGKRWNREVPEAIGRKARGIDDYLEAAPILKRKHGGALDEVLTATDEAAAKAGEKPTVWSLLETAERVKADVAKKDFLGEVTPKIDKFIERVKQDTGFIKTIDGEIAPASADFTYRQLRDWRKLADDSIFSAVSPELKGYKQDLYKLRDAMEKQVEDGIKKFSPTDFAKYTEAKKGYQAAATLEKVAEKGKASGGTNRFFGLGEQTGAIAGGVVGGLPGAMIGAGISRIVKDKGDFIAADVLQNLSRLAAVEKQALTLDNKITQGIDGFLTSARKGAVRSGVMAYGRDTDKQVKQIQAIAQARTPDEQMRRVEAFVGPQMVNYAPGIQQHVQMKSLQIMQNVVKQLPPMRTQTIQFGGKPKAPRIDDFSLRKAASYIEGVKNPTSVLDDMKDGLLDRQKALAVKENFPRLWEQIRDEMIEKVANDQIDLDESQKVQASILFGVPLTDTMQPQFIAKMQMANAPKEEGQAPSQQGGGRRPIKLDTSTMQTSAEKAEGVDYT